MKTILGLDLGSNSIGWALVHEAENGSEQSGIIKLGVRPVPLTIDEITNFEKGKSITTNAERRLKRSMHRNLQRYKLRKENLIKILKHHRFITDRTLLSEDGNKTTFETYRLRARAVVEEISLEEFARVLLMINKKRGYKSNRKTNPKEDGQAIDGMDIAKRLYDEQITVGQLSLQLLQSGKKYLPDFYRSDLQEELYAIWNMQKLFYPELLTDDFLKLIENKSKSTTTKIFLKEYGIYTAENKGKDKKLEAYQWRANAVNKQISKEELAFVISEVNGHITNSSGYLGDISDRSKELYFNRQTVGQFLMDSLDKNPHAPLRNRVFYRQDYLNEFEALWETQAKFHPELTKELKTEIRDVVIFYQRRLKSQKGLISFCEFESRQIVVKEEGKKKTKTIGSRVIPRSSPLFQEFKIRQTISDLEISGLGRDLYTEEKELLFDELTLRDELKKEDILKLLFKKHEGLDLNFKKIDGNRTQAALFAAYLKIIELSGHDISKIDKMQAKDKLKATKEIFAALGYNTDILTFNSDEKPEKQEMYKLWHLLYSFEGDNSKTGSENLIDKLSKSYGFEKEFATILANVTFGQDDYGSLSAKAIRNILPKMKEGKKYSSACEDVGYRHSKSSLTKEEIENKVLKDKLDILPKNSLRNPVVEKILNQMINVVNTIIDTYGKPDEVRIELARELKKSAQEREDLSQAIAKSTNEHEQIRGILNKEFGLQHASRNDIIRYKLYEELNKNGYHTLYSNTYIPQEKLFSKEFDIEHIIPQSRLFDDSFSNKTLEKREVNIEKGNDTAYDYVEKKYGEDNLAEYSTKIESLFKQNAISKGKRNKLLMAGKDIPDGFIERDLRESQYIAKKAKSILEELVKTVVSTTGSVTDRLRNDWQLVDIMKELNWDKYDQLEMTEVIENKDGQRIKRIKDWTKRNDHRHHAMDALTVAFTKHSYIQYLNYLNARVVEGKQTSSIKGIEQKELTRKNGSMRFNPPMPLEEFRAEAKKHLESILVSSKAKNKVATANINITKKAGGKNKKKQLTPRGQLHNETLYGSIQRYSTKEEKVGSAFDEAKIQQVAKKQYREALLNRLHEFNNDPKKAFTGKNSLEKNPIWLNKQQTACIPAKVKTVSLEKIYTIRKEISPDLRLDKVVDVNIRRILQAHLNKHGGDTRKAFSNLDENPIWLNEEKGISIKRVTITGIANGEPIHTKKDKDGNLILDKDGQKQGVDFVSTSNNHHVAIYRDAKGELQESIISFYEATARATLGLPIINKEYKRDEGYEFLFTMKQNEYFVFPNEKTGFNPKEEDLLDPDNYSSISPNLFRVQKMSLTSGFWFRHHLETTVDSDKRLRDITYKIIQSTKNLKGIVKVRLNHIGHIIHVGEY